jgi:ABC-2 type transport system ATP-binding protein
MAEPIISVQHLEKRFDGISAVSGISFDIQAGEFFGLLGPNGAGKSTTISMLTGLVKPTRGDIFIEGNPIPSHLRETRARLGFVPQDFAFYPTMSARDNLSFFGRVYGLAGRRLKRRREEVLGAVGLSDHSRQTVLTFSNGMKRRLNLAIALIHEPVFLILDEPTVGVDAHSRHLLLERLGELNQKGVTVLYTTHLMEEAQKLCHRVAVMDRGNIIALDSPASLIHQFGRGGIRIAFSHGINQTFLDRLAELGDLKKIDGDGHEIFLHTHQTERGIKKIIELSQQHQVSIKTINILEDDLESVFLYLTGRYLRDQNLDE